MFDTPISTPQRIRRSRDEWQSLIEDCKHSNLEPEQYCSQHQLNLDRFRLWQRRLESNVLDGLFVEVQPDRTQDHQWTIELTLGDLSLKLTR